VAPKAARRAHGGCTFAEDPGIGVPGARVIWEAAYDPGTLVVAALATGRDDPDGIDPALLGRWLTMVAGADGIVHAVLSDGYRRIRLDIVTGPLEPGRGVVMHYRLHGVRNALPKILPLRRMLDLCRYRRFAASLFPPDRRMARWTTLLRVHDAAGAGASHREIAAALFGEDTVRRAWRTESDFLRSRVRRLIADARAMAQGGWRFLMGGGPT
jgi:hypothetical protein